MTQRLRPMGLTPHHSEVLSDAKARIPSLYELLINVYINQPPQVYPPDCLQSEIARQQNSCPD